MEFFLQQALMRKWRERTSAGSFESTTLLQIASRCGFRPRAAALRILHEPDVQWNFREIVRVLLSIV